MNDTVYIYIIAVYNELHVQHFLRWTQIHCNIKTIEEKYVGYLYTLLMIYRCKLDSVNDLFHYSYIRRILETRILISFCYLMYEAFMRIDALLNLLRDDITHHIRFRVY